MSQLAGILTLPCTLLLCNLISMNFHFRRSRIKHRSFVNLTAGVGSGYLAYILIAFLIPHSGQDRHVTMIIRSRAQRTRQELSSLPAEGEDDPMDLKTRTDDLIVIATVCRKCLPLEPGQHDRRRRRPNQRALFSARPVQAAILMKSVLDHVLQCLSIELYDNSNPALI